MKKIGIYISIIILLIAITILPATYSYATTLEPTADIAIPATMTITPNTTTLEFTIALTDISGFTQSEETIDLGYEAKLEYDGTIFSSAREEALNGWILTYDDTTKILIGDAKAKIESQQIGKIILTLNENIEPGTTTVKLSGLLGIGEDFEQNFEKELVITIAQKETQEDPEEDNNAGEQTNDNQEEEQTKEQQEESTQQDGETPTNSNGEEKTNTAIKANDDKTTSSNKLPKTGATKIVLIALIITIAGIGCLIRYKSIQTK